MILTSFLLLAPAKSEASLVSDFINKVFSAEEEQVVENEQNSQTVQLLQPVSKLDPSSKGTSDITILNDSAFATDTGLLGSSADLEDGIFIDKKISTYVVRKGDTISSVAKLFDVSENTIIWSNNLKKGEALKVDETLVVLPVSGVKYTVKKGDNLKSIAKKFKADVDDIELFNGLNTNSKLVVGDEIIVPDGEITEIVSVKIIPKNIAKKENISVKKDTSGYFAYPTASSVRRTRGITKTHKGVDLAAPVGTPIYAAASGKVIVARPEGYNGGYGKMIVIEHNNGTQTIYGHLSKLFVSNGDTVSQGQNIAAMGNTGRSTGSHLHFQVLDDSNPF